jgi:hypothetical protein
VADQAMAAFRTPVPDRDDATPVGQPGMHSVLLQTQGRMTGACLPLHR